MRSKRLKLRYSRRSGFRRRSALSRALPVVLSLLGAVAIIAVGFFGAKLLAERPALEPNISAPDASAVTPEDSAPETDQPVIAPAGDDLRAFYLPHHRLVDRNALTATMQQAVAAGYNSLIFDMKDVNGTLYFRSATERAARVNSFAADAFTVAELQELFAAIRQAGLRPIPRLHAFRDNAAARVLADARVSPMGYAGQVWYDNNPANGGKAWLNPYADAARLYIIDLARELRDAGAAAILLDSVHFPFQVSSADFGSKAAEGQSRSAALTDFITEAAQLLGNDCPVMVSCTAESALGENTQVYGGNPLTFGAAAYLPQLSLADTALLQSQVHQMHTRILLLSNYHPTIAPLLAVADATPDAIKAAAAACAAGGTEELALYHPEGQYDFAALQ